jgi:hypothetical protein
MISRRRDDIWSSASMYAMMLTWVGTREPLCAVVSE